MSGIMMPAIPLFGEKGQKVLTVMNGDNLGKS
jgi:hypothetical protein